MIVMADAAAASWRYFLARHDRARASLRSIVRRSTVQLRRVTGIGIAPLSELVLLSTNAKTSDQVTKLKLNEVKPAGDKLHEPFFGPGALTILLHRGCHDRSERR
jgi:hypothetical protein